LRQIKIIQLHYTVSSAHVHFGYLNLNIIVAQFISGSSIKDEPATIIPEISVILVSSIVGPV
jgi:hypothetical protein